MNESKTRDKILKRIRQALMDKSQEPFTDVNFKDKTEDFDEQEFPEILFAEKFIAAGGNFSFCENEQELRDFIHQVAGINHSLMTSSHPVLKNFVEEIKMTNRSTSSTEIISLSSCFCLCAFPLSIILSSSSYFQHAKKHLLVVEASRAVHELKQGLNRIKESVRLGLEHSFEIISFAESDQTENTALLQATDFYVALVDWKLS